MTRHPMFGLMLALFGVLVLTPDALLMRLSGMVPTQMMGWRGLTMGGTLILAWLILSRDRGRDLGALSSGPGVTIALCQCANSGLFSFGIGTAPVAMVLLGIATVPVFAALFARVIMNEPTRRATWVTIVVVMLGIAVAAFGHGAGVGLDAAALRGALAGLGVAMVLALNFVTMRAHPHLPIPLVIGTGALVAGVTGTLLTGLGAMPDGQVWAIVLTGGVVLPVAFFCLSLASRHTHASNVSLLMLLETILAPLWVWLALGEAMTPAMLVGGAIVVISVGFYVRHTGRKAGAARRVRPVRG